LRRIGLEKIDSTKTPLNASHLFTETIVRGAMDMKKLRWSFLIFAVLGLSMAHSFLNEASGATAVTLKVLNPRGEITPPPVNAPSARISDWGGKKIAIYWNGKAGGDNFWNNVEALLKEKLPNASVLRYNGPFDLGDTQAARIAKEADGFFYGVGD
jgi:hypothetical protein